MRMYEGIYRVRDKGRAEKAVLNFFTGLSEVCGLDKVVLRASVCYSGLVMTQKIIKTGNSAAVTIPSEMLKSLNLQVGDRVEAKLSFAEGSITYIFPEIRQLRLEEAKKNKK